MELAMDSTLKHRGSSNNMKPFLQRFGSDRTFFTSRDRLIRLNSKIKFNPNGGKSALSSKTLKKMQSADGLRWFNNDGEVDIGNKAVYYPPIMLPPIYSMKPLPFQERDMTYPTPKRGPITEKEWLELRACRYLRPRLHPQERQRRYRKT